MKNSLMALAFVPFMALNMPQHQAHEFAPENNLKLSVNMNFSGISEEEFTAALDKVERIYSPIFEKRDATFVVRRFWEDGTVNAYAEQNGDQWIISMFGGLARHQEVTQDGFTLVACHEIGHHIGGHPKMGWASNEGESDYYGTLKCLHRIWADEDSVSIVANMKIDEVAALACEKAWSKAMDVAVCKRSAMAGKGVARLLAQLGGQTMPEFDTPDKSKTETTINYHPPAQCRMDTYFAGALCTVDFNIDVDDVDPTIGVCALGEVGGRPRCWFNIPDPNAPPPDDEEERQRNQTATARRY
ncbi:MAG: hypothetical protein SGJ18_12080 [Pseudomonadota bacterium]|nr:hypothetical protein [Pseudomonadota bacterium]